MGYSCKIYVETDLASLRYVTFIESLAVCSTKALSFNSNEPTNNVINKVIEENTNEPIVLLEEHFFTAFLVQRFWCTKNLTNLNLKICHMKLSNYSHNHKVSNRIFVNDKFYHDKVIL
jgi:hypothetical protein